MKILKFSVPLPDLILKGEKDTTWRINDEKDIQIGDELSLLARPELNEFAKASVTSVRNITFGTLIEEDTEGHEKFDSEEEKYKVYSEYYNTEITAETELKVIKFNLI